MSSEREFLPVGTMVRFESGSSFEITGEPIGLGGGSIIYPAERVYITADGLRRDGISYALKECYPETVQCRFHRTEFGEVVPQGDDPFGEAYLNRVKQLQLDERLVTQHIYRTGSRLLPVLESSAAAALCIPGGEWRSMRNVYTVMESLSSKGRSLHAYMEEYGRLSTRQTFHIVRQLLFALREIHAAGYLHLDIQDGNVFIKGSLEDESDLVTMIDFGSARPLVNGKTESIADRVVFTTDGFSAPEIQLHNDGTLRLGVEADLYSVGCMTLFLLTGSRPDSFMLQNHTGGKYLSRFRLRKIDCPKHLVDRMQAIIAHALEKEAENRYHSTDEMLADVSDFLQALQPVRSALADTVYDAFICYRHGPIDSIAAKKLQEFLEHYRVPPKLTEKGEAWHRRIFVDEGELSSCADIGQQIRDALKNANWLIVVCSPGTADSPWVNLEIDTFLEYHDRSRLLAVLTGGEPENAFPRELRGSEGRNEVLAADARGQDAAAVVKRLKKDVLLKLAAPMLGTTFDSLRQRRRIYVLQRMVAAAVIVLAVVSAFLAYTIGQAQLIRRQGEEIEAKAQEIQSQADAIAEQNGRIIAQAAEISTQADEISAQAAEIAAQAERVVAESRKALENQSQYMVGQALSLLESGDRFSAIRTAIDAVPMFQGEPLLVPGAELALTEATAAYASPFSNDLALYPVGTISPEEAFVFNVKNGRIFIRFENTLEIWDAEKLKPERSVTVEGAILHYVFREKTKTAILQTAERITCFDSAETGIVWTVDAESPFSLMTDFADQTRLAVLSEEDLLIIDADTGICLRMTSFPWEAERMRDSEFLTVSKNGRWIAFTVYDRLAEEPGSAIVLYDTEEEAFRVLPDHFILINGVRFMDPDHLVVTADSTGNFYMSDTLAYSLYQDMDAQICCIDCTTGDIVWDHTFSCQVDTQIYLGHPSAVFGVSYPFEEQTVEALLYLHANEGVVLDMDSGDVLRSYQLPSYAITGRRTDKGFLAVTHKGELIVVSFDENEWEKSVWRGVPFSSKNIKSGVWDGDDLYVRMTDLSFDGWNGRQIFKFRYRSAGDGSGYQSLCYERMDTSRCDFSSPLTTTGKYVVWGIDDPRDTLYGGHIGGLVVADLEKREVREYPLDDKPDLRFRYLGISPDEETVYLYCDSDSIYSLNQVTELLEMDLGSGEIVWHTIPISEPDERRYRVLDECFYDNGVFVVTIYEGSDSDLWVEDSYAYRFLPENDTLVLLCEEPVKKGFFESVNLTVSPDGSSVWIYNETVMSDEAIYLSVIHLNDGKTHRWSDADLNMSDAHAGIFESSKLFVSPSGRTAFFIYGDCYAILDSETLEIRAVGSIQALRMDRFETNGLNAVWFSGDEKAIFLYCTDDSLFAQRGLVFKLDMLSGRIVETYELDQYLYGFSKGRKAVTVTEDGDTVALFSYYGGCILINTENDALDVLAVVECCRFYDRENDRFILIGVEEGEIEVGASPHYSIPELIALGRSIIETK